MTPAPRRLNAAFHVLPPEVIRHLHASFSDLSFTTERMVFEGSFGATQFTMHGTQQLDFLGIPSRGHRLCLPFLVISRFEGGKVAEDWELFDSAEMRRQLEGGAAVVA